GFKAHVAVEPDTGIITNCALTKATGPDNHETAVGLDLLAAEPHSVTVLADAAYGSGEFRAQLAARGHADRVDPPLVRSAFPGG
ncbi:transposase, partial [Mycobacterium szulgai]